jgi:Protein of unknown function (DUF3040)
VALPMDEQRILDEMERMLAADDPKLAARLAAFGQPGFGHVLRTRRARATMSVMVLALIAAVAAVIYMMSSFRPGSTPHRHLGHSVVSTRQTNPKGTPATSQVTASERATAQRAQGSQPIPKTCTATFCGRPYIYSPDRPYAQAHRQVSRP